MVGETLEQRQKKHKKQSDNPHAMGWFNQFGSGNCAVNNALFNASTKMGCAEPAGGCATADGGCGTVTPAPAGGSMGEDLEDRRNDMSVKTEGYKAELAGPWEIGIDYHSWKTFDNGDGTSTTRYVLCNPLTDEQIAELSKYSNVSYKKDGATYRYAPEIKYDTLYVTLPRDDEDFDYDDAQIVESKGRCGKEKKAKQKSESMKWMEKYLHEAVYDGEDDEEEPPLNFDGMAIDDDTYFTMDSEDPEYDTTYAPITNLFTADFDDDLADDDNSDIVGYLGKYDVLDSKRVLDDEGFRTDYTLFHDNDTDGYFTVFGDTSAVDKANDLHDVADAWFSSYVEARAWFDGFEGFKNGEFENDGVCYDMDGNVVECGETDDEVYVDNPDFNYGEAAYDTFGAEDEDSDEDTEDDEGAEDEVEDEEDEEEIIGEGYDEDVKLDSSLSKDYKVRKLADEIKALEDEVNFLTFDSDDDPDTDNAVAAAKRELARARAKYKTLTREETLYEAPESHEHI